VRAVVLAAACLTFAACGESETRPPDAATPAADAVVDVDMTNNRFEPRRAVAGLGESVRWINRDPVAHTVASQELRLSSEAIRPGESFTYRPRRAGSFRYFCTIHFGQTGRLEVR
jgi:plastocyanin